MIHYKRGLSVEERFWAKVQKTDGCWLWIAGTIPDGYGVIAIKFQNGWRSVLAHRLAWEFKNGPIPEGMEVCHSCDIRNCVREDHLFLGTRLDNIRDAAEKGRLLRINEYWV
jgi:hypothetical protein